MSKKTYTGINIQWPISELILSGQKTIETRTYPIPVQYLNQDLLVIETPGKREKFKARIVAIIKFSHCIEYKNKIEFYKDTNKHFVTPDSIWAWGEKEKYGWEISYIKKLSEITPAPLKKGIVFTKNISLHVNV